MPSHVVAPHGNAARSKSPRDPAPVWWAILVALIASGTYLMTLSPGVSWAHHSEDSGDLIVSAWLLGIPHPTGYPLFCMLGWLWSHVLPFGSVAWRMNAFSAFWGAMAAAMTVRAVWASFRLLPCDTLMRLSRPGQVIASCSSGLILALATNVWSLSIVTEIYSLNLFFTSLIGWILIELLLVGKNMEATTDEEEIGRLGRRRRKLIAFLGLSWGLALTNHLTSLFLLPGILLVLFIGGLKTRPADFGKGILWLILPLLLYLYLPVRSLMNPPLDWGNPETFDNFIAVVTGMQFRQLMFTLFPYQMLHQIMKYGWIPGEIGGLGALAAGLGVIRLILGKNRGIIILLVHSLLLVASSLFYLSSYYIWDPEGYLLPMTWATALWAGWAIVLLVDIPLQIVPYGRLIAIALLILAPLGALIGHYENVDLSGTREAIHFGEESFEAFEENALVLEIRYERAFTLWYFREIEYAETRDDVAVVYVEHATFDWGLDLLRRKYPEIVLPDRPITAGEKEAATAAWIIEHNINERPVYSGATVDELVERGYRFDAVGLMYRVLPPGGT